VDFELRGCPINKNQLVELVAALVVGRKPRVPRYSVCLECKRLGTVCVAVAQGVPCMGPLTQAGCGAICPSFNRECFGCYGPQERPNAASLTGWYREAGAAPLRLIQLTRNFNGYAPELREASEALSAAKGAGAGRD
jgi:coenzyme F420-reducing hydrogenase gamma subunit